MYEAAIAYRNRILYQADTGAGSAAPQESPAKQSPKQPDSDNQKDVNAQPPDRAAGPAGAATPSAAAQQQSQQNAPRLSQAAAMLGEVVWLLTRSDAHKHLFLTELDWLVMPALQLRQFRIWRHENQPVAFASWAYLSDEAAERFVAEAKSGRMGRIGPNEWKSGEALWLIDFVTPFGGADNMIKELREKVFEGQKIKTLQPAPDGSGPAVVEW